MFRSSLFAIAVSGSLALAADPKKPTYDDDVLPILKQHCNNCHGNDKQSAGLNLATFAALGQGGSSGDVVKSGEPDKSRLYLLTAHKEKPEMPPKSAKIADAQIEIIKHWIEQGLRENSGSKIVPAKPKVEIGLSKPGKGKPEGPPPMPAVGKLNGDPLLRSRRPGAVTAMAASPWAPIVAVGATKQILLFHTDTGDLLGALPFDQGQVNSLQFSRNAKFLLASGGRGGASGKAVLFNIETCAKITDVGIESDAILAADVSPDQTLIAVGSPSKLVRIYSTLDGSVVREIKKHTDWVTAVEFSPDGVLLATGDRNGGLFVWEANTGREFHSLRGHTGNITDLSWRDDGNLVASSSEDGTIRLWEMENGTAAKNWAAHAGGTASVKFGHDGKLASTGRDKTVKLWDGGGTLLKQYAETFPDLGLKVAISHDNARVIAGDWAGNLKAWTVADSKLAYIGDSNPLPLADRMMAMEAAYQAADAKQKQAAAALTAAEEKNKAAQVAFTTAQTNSTKIPADLAAANKIVEAKTKEEATAKAALAPLKAEVEKANAAKEAGIASEKKAKENFERISKLVAANAATPDELKNAQTSVDKAVKVLGEQTKTATEANTKFAAATKTATDLTVAIADAKKRVADLTPMVAPAQTAVAPAKVAAEAAAKAVEPAKAAADAATAEASALKIRLDQMKSKK